MWDGFFWGFYCQFYRVNFSHFKSKQSSQYFAYFARFSSVLLWRSFAFICLLDAFICLAFLFRLVCVCIFMSLALAAV